MPQLVFRVASDWEEVVKLRNEIAKLKQELKNMDSTQLPAAFNALNTQLSASTQRMDELVGEAAKAGAVMEGSFKKKIFDASQTVNGFTEKIIAQKAVVKDIEADVKRLGDAYRTVLKRNPLSASGKLEEYNAARKALDEEKATLFGLTQEQANARLSVKKLRDEYALYNNDGKQVAETNNGIAVSWKKVLAVIGGVAALKTLGSEIIRVRGEFQSMQTAIETMVGKDIAGKLIPQIKEIAKVSPLTLTDFVGAEKMMLGFNIESEKTIRYLQALSDISMGETQKFNSLTLAFSQMSAAGKLMGQDLNQMINAGFNPLQTMSEKTGKSIATLKDEMSKGAISAEMVQQAFLDATSAGGKFYQMSENASKTINGQLSMMRDAMDAAFNEMGQKSEGAIMKGIQTTTSLIENYETIGNILTGLVAVYGVYKAAVITNIVLTDSWAAATKADAVAKGMQTVATKAQTIATSALNAVMKLTPWGLALTGAVAIAAAMWTLSGHTTEAEKAQLKLNSAIKEAEKSSLAEQRELAKLKGELSALTKGTDEYNSVKDKIVKGFGKYYSGLDAEIEKVGLTEVAYNKLTEAINKSFSARQYEKFALEQQSELSNTMSDNLANIQDRLYDKLGDEYGAKIYTKIRDAVMQGSLSLEGPFDIAGFDSETLTALDKVAGKDGGLFDVTNRAVEGYLQNIILANKQTDELDKKARERFGIDDNQKGNSNSTISEVDTEKKSGTEWLAVYKKKYDDAEKAYNDFLKSKKVMSDAERDAELKRLKGLRDEAKTTYEDKGGVTNTSNQDSAAEKLRKEQEKYNLLMDKQSLEQKRSAEDLQMKVDESRIKAMDEGSKKAIAEMELNFEKEMQVIDRQKEDALRKKIEDARSVWEADPKNKKKSFDATGIKLSEEENKKYDALYKAQTESFEKEKLRTEALAMREYLKEYGTFQQQKLAIAEEYAEKIKNAQFESERLTLGKQRDAALLNIDVQAAKQDIDWQSIFGDLGMMLKEQIQPTIDNLKTVIQSKEFQNSSIEDQQKIYDLLSDLEKRSGTFGKDMFKDVSRDLQLFRNSLNAYNEAKQREIKAANELAVAQERLKMAQENGEDTTSAQQAVDDAQDAFNQASESVKALGEKASENANTLHSSSEKVRGALEGLVSGLDKLKSGSLQQAFDGVKDIGGVLSKVIGGKIGKAIENIDPTGIISGVLSILDILKDGFSSIFVSLQDTMYGAIEGILNDIYSGDIIVKPIQNALSHVGSILNTITFGGFNSIFGASGNSKEVNAIVGRLTESNKYLITAIDKLTDEMEKSGGKQSTEYYESAHEKQVQKVENDRQMLEAKMKYNSSHHSNDYYINKAFNADDWKKASDYVGVQMKQAGDLWKLSPEDLAKLQELPDIWNKIHSGKYDQSEWLDNYVEDADKLEELTEKWHESLNQTSLDTFKSGFLDTLMDMDSSSEDFAENFEEYLKKSILSALIADNYANEIEELYKEWAKAGEDGEYDEGEINRLRERQEKLSNKMLADRDALADAMGWESDSESTREATQKGIATASQDSVDENNGRLAVMQEHTFSINENVNRMAAGIDTIASHTANLSCLTSIDKTMQSLLTMRNEAVGHLSNIDNYTSNLVEMKQYMNSMKQDINTMLIKGLKLSKN